MSKEIKKVELDKIIIIALETSHLDSKIEDLVTSYAEFNTMIFDLNRVSGISSDFIGRMINTSKKGKNVYISCKAPSPIRESLDLVKSYDFLNVFGSVSEALEHHSREKTNEW